MNRNRSGRDNPRLTLLLLAALTAILGLRVRSTWALAGTPVGPPVPAEVTSALTVDGERLQAQQRLLATGAPVRNDPFRREAVVPMDVPPALGDAPAEVKKLVGPALSALLYDHRDPTTQITVDGERSGWLRPGDTFRGWTVTAISPRTVTITKGGKVVILP